MRKDEAQLIEAIDEATSHVLCNAALYAVARAVSALDAPGQEEVDEDFGPVTEEELNAARRTAQPAAPAKLSEGWNCPTCGKPYVRWDGVERRKALLRGKT